MECDRYFALGDLPAEVACSNLYDGDVIQERDGRCLTVFQQWHGEFEVTTRCLTGALRLDGSDGFGYSDPVIEFRESDRVTLAGSLSSDEGLSLRPLPGQPNTHQKISAYSVSRVQEGDSVIAADGLAYVVVNAFGGVEMRRLWYGIHKPIFDGVNIDSYLDSILPAQSEFVVMAVMGGGGGTAR